jgi:hypothetical protein
MVHRVFVLPSTWRFLANSSSTSASELLRTALMKAPRLVIIAHPFTFRIFDVGEVILFGLDILLYGRGNSIHRGRDSRAVLYIPDSGHSIFLYRCNLLDLRSWVDEIEHNYRRVFCLSFPHYRFFHCGIRRCSSSYFRDIFHSVNHDRDFFFFGRVCELRVDRIGNIYDKFSSDGANRI